MRPTPHAVEAERALLGGLLQRPDELPRVDEMLSPEHFYRPEHGVLYALLLDMYGNKESVDTISVLDRIRREGRHEKYGGVAYVLELPDQVPSTANLPHYARIIQEKAVLRDLIRVGSEVVERAYAQPEDLDVLLTDAARDIADVAVGRKHDTWHAISLIVDEELSRIQQLGERDGTTTGHSTGFVDLDERLAGLHPTNLVILAARPAMGKTALALNIAQNVAVIEERAVAIFSLEMGRAELVNRMLCCHGRVDAGRVRKGTLDTNDWDRLLEASEMLRTQRILIDDTGGLTIGDVRSRARRLKAEHPDLGLIVIDYLQLMQGEDRRASREQSISAISRGLKGLAKDLECPVLALSQLNRGVESRQDKRPLVSDLRESGAIEQDADVILFIYRDEYYHPDSPDQGLAEVIIAKQRSGPTGTVKLVFQGHFARFDSYTPNEPEL